MDDIVAEVKRELCNDCHGGRTMEVSDCNRQCDEFKRVYQEIKAEWEQE